VHYERVTALIWRILEFSLRFFLILLFLVGDLDNREKVPRKWRDINAADLDFTAIRANNIYSLPQFAFESPIADILELEELSEPVNRVSGQTKQETEKL
jgi:hypothetical protein